MLFRGIKHQVDKGPVDSVTGKAKYTLNDNRLLREDVEYRPLVRGGEGGGGRGERENLLVSQSPMKVRRVTTYDCVGVCIWFEPA